MDNRPISHLYEAQVANGDIEPNDGQRALLPLLDHLCVDIAAWDKAKKGLFQKPAMAPRGLYIYGGVGAGKSMLMDLFFATVPVLKKRRVHFHAFMQEAHGFIGAWRKMDQKARKAHAGFVRGAGDDPIAPLARFIANGSKLLCFDEFQVSDIADAMILGRLFEALFKEGVVVVATSNRPPKDLYKNGLNRQLFEPFIQMLESYLDVASLTIGKDFRQHRLPADARYFSPLGPKADAAMAEVFGQLAHGAKGRPVTLTIHGHRLTVPQAANGYGIIDFATVCGQAFGAADYLAIADGFDGILLANVPVMGPEMRAEAARFRNLIDALYEAKTLLIMSAAAAPNQLYAAGDQAFEFERTASRLYEMASVDYPN